MWKKYCRAGQATDYNIARRTRIACWITKATDTHSEYVILIAFHGKMIMRKSFNVTFYIHCPSCCQYDILETLSFL